VTADDAFIGGGFHNLAVRLRDGGGGRITTPAANPPHCRRRNNTSSGDWSASGGNNNTAAGRYSLPPVECPRRCDDSFVWNSYAIPLHHRADEFFVFAQNGFSVDYNTQRLDGAAPLVYIGTAVPVLSPLQLLPPLCLEWELT